MDKPDICPDEIYGIMEHCWEYNPDDRPSAKDLVKKLIKYVDDEVGIDVSFDTTLIILYNSGEMLPGE